jgi:extracellular factor (EF) 3-hydroxypalmitic acid methyl ester biosynthesis protein
VSRLKQDDPVITAYLEHNDQLIPVTAKYASKYSLFIKFKQGFEFKCDDTFTLIVENNSGFFNIGPCRLISDPNQNGQDGRLFFLDDVYDIHSLLSNNKLVKIQSLFNDLPSILARKKKINKSFKNFTANLTYDLSVYKNLFDRLDSKYQDEPEPIKKAVQKAIIKTDGQKLWRFLNEKLAELEDLVADFSADEHQCHGFYFRRQLWNFLLCSPFMARTNLKPRGYPGDSETMRMIYLNDYQGESTFSKLLHKHGVEHTAAQSVRNRITLIVNLLHNFQKNEHVHSPNKLNVLSVGSGPALEFHEIFKSSNDCSKFNFYLLDNDPMAHSEAVNLVQTIERKLKAKIDVNFIHGSVRTMLFSRSLNDKLVHFDFIYSMGLFDYLSDTVAKAVIKRLYKMLKPGGEMVIGNFHTSNPSKYYMSYWFDWVLNLRTEEEIITLLSDISNINHSIIFEDTGSQMFLHLKTIPNHKNR